ncbi:MAG: hypothetical protein JRN39_03680 [Nitrososphaerota archaeon]|nr:hypothetical protein [Nitrososphaerota archaeon]
MEQGLTKGVKRVEDGAEAFVEVLNSIPTIEYIFADTGTDHAPLIEALARLDEAGRKRPKLITAPHEIAAVSMAIGYYAVSGSPQIALVHTVPGTLNAHGMVANAFSSRIPLILVAGRTPVTESGIFGGKTIGIHWTQETRDQGGLIRDCVKWDYEHRTNSQIADVVFRAHKIAMSEPRGPVYLIFPRELWAEKVKEVKIPPRGRYAPAAPPRGNPEQIKEAAEALLDAESPLAIPDASGRSRAFPAALVRLSDLVGLRVTPTFNTMSYPTNDTSFLGQHGSGGQQGSSSSHMKEADALLLLDTAVPWIPNLASPREDAKTILVDADPSFANIPIWSFPIDLPIAAASDLAVQAMADAAEDILSRDPGRRRVVAQ